MKPPIFSQQRVEPTKKTLAVRKIAFTEIYEPIQTEDVQAQAQRCLSCGSPFCAWKCPVHNPIPSWLKLAAQGRVIEAAELCHHTNSLPEICGRVCPQDKLCEAACVLHDELGSVTIGHIERYINDTAFELGWRPDVSSSPSTGKHVAVIGAGPAGLACADVLARNGVQATVFDKHPEIGGLLTFGIPAFKLEKSVMVRRREIFNDMGIQFKLNTEIGRDLPLETLLTDYDAIFLGTGVYQSITGQLPTQRIQGIYKALPYLIANTRQLMGYPVDPQMPYINLQGKKVVVLGGGDTAMDCVRSAIRQGALSVTCVYRRDEHSMPGSTREKYNAQEEGATFCFNAIVTQFMTDKHGTLNGLNLQRTENGEYRPPKYQINPIENSDFFIDAEAVIVAFGFRPHDLPWLAEHHVQLDEQGLIRVERHSPYPMQTSHPQIFAGGDTVRGSDLVVTAIADGRNAAEGILLYLGI